MCMQNCDLFARMNGYLGLQNIGQFFFYLNSHKEKLQDTTHYEKGSEHVQVIMNSVMFEQCPKVPPIIIIL